MNCILRIQPKIDYDGEVFCIYQMWNPLLLYSFNKDDNKDDDVRIQMQQIKDHILCARELKKNLKSQLVQNKMQIIVFTCQDNNAPEENMRISWTSREK